ncbi:hypothetical protein F2Q69_00022268 [Brassica cretica]|uniref:RNase H type-1 domain-containing protein n=1 Tax=Brassica cretica TaxID=69181 RepID=A0A8S9Q3E3_BRACR|nr:hypothetical protein F2Q69_00022268 [Brassica cretica]
MDSLELVQYSESECQTWLMQMKWDTLGKIQVIGTRNFTELKTARDYFTFRSGSNAMRVCYNTHHVRALEQTCKDLIVMIRDPHAWPSFATELKAIKTMEICFPNFKISHIPRA